MKFRFQELRRVRPIDEGMHLREAQLQKRFQEALGLAEHGRGQVFHDLGRARANLHQSAEFFPYELLNPLIEGRQLFWADLFVYAAFFYRGKKGVQR